MTKATSVQQTIGNRPDQRARNSLRKIFKKARVSASTPQGRVRKRKLRILSIDGGGIRAILPALILAQLEERLQQVTDDPDARIVDQFDLFAGTSAGGILTTLYLTPDPDRPGRPRYSARQVLERYLQDGGSGFTPVKSGGGRSRREKYCAATLEAHLRNALGAQIRLDQLIRPVLITAFNVDTETPVYFNSWQNGRCKAWQVARATAAAPGFFLPASFDELQEGMELIDGSVFASNPAMCAYALAGNTRFSGLPVCTYPGNFPGPEDMVLVSVGTGKIPPLGKNAGSLMRILMKNCMSSSAELINYQLQQLFAARRQGAYFRFNPQLPATDAAIDAVEKQHIEALYALGSLYLEEEGNKLETLLVSLLE